MITGIRIGAFEHGPRTQGEPHGPFQPGPRPGDGAARPAPLPPPDTPAAGFEHRFAVDGPPSATPGSNRVPPPRPAGTQLQLPLSYEQRPPGALQADPDHPGIHTDTKGQRYIQDAQHTYAVRFDAGNGTWRVYQPDNPTRPGIAVRQNADGRWQIHHDVGLPGGLPPETENRIVEELRNRPQESYTAIAQTVGVSPQAVRGIAKKNRLQRQSHQITPDKKNRILEELRNHPDKSYDAIISEFNISSPTLRKIANESGLQRQYGWISNEKKEQIRSELINHPNDKYSSIASKFGVSKSATANIARRMGFPKKFHQLTLDQKQHITDELRNHPGVTCGAISKKLGISVANVRYFARQNGLLASHDPISPETRNQILEELRRDPHQSYAAIANNFGVLYPDVEELAGSLNPPSPGNPPGPAPVPPRDNTAPAPHRAVDDVGQAGPSGTLPSQKRCRADPPAAHTPLTHTEQEEIRQLHDIGLDNTHIAIYVGKPKPIIDDYMTRTHPVPVAAVEPLTEDQREDIERLGRAGVEAVEIAKATRVSQSKVEQYMQSDEYKYFVL